MKINSEELQNEQSDKLETEALMVREKPINNTHTAMARTSLESLRKRTEKSILLAVRNNLDSFLQAVVGGNGGQKGLAGRYYQI